MTQRKFEISCHGKNKDDNLPMITKTLSAKVSKANPGKVMREARRRCPKRYELKSIAVKPAFSGSGISYVWLWGNWKKNEKAYKEAFGA